MGLGGCDGQQEEEPEDEVLCRVQATKTKIDSYPLPCIDESLDLVSSSSWFSSLDRRSGYWQVP